MFNFKNLFFILLFSAISTGFVIAQPPSAISSKSSTSPEKPKFKESFVSLDGGFTIALPQITNGMNSIKPATGVSKGGIQFIWKAGQAVFVANVTERIVAPKNIKQELEAIVGNFIQTQEQTNIVKLIDKKEISLGGMPGTEARLRIGADAKGIVRFYIVDKRVFGLAASFKDGEDEISQLQILNSFKLIDKKTAIAKKLQEVTPNALPQLPVVKKTKSDAEDDGLKGKVRLVSESREDLTKTSNSSGMKLSFENYYDERGNQVKYIYYDYRSNPDSITVYGFIDGMRVSDTGWMHYEYNPPPPPIIPAVKETPKPIDLRYGIKYEYKYDEKNRLKEISTYNNKGEFNSRIIYIYIGNKLEKTSYGRDAKVNSKTIEIFDDKGNLIETTRVGNEKYPDSKYIYTYESFDKKGNWTKRKVSGKAGQYNGGYKDLQYIEYRTITYFQ
jgi:hypothetical protein